MSNEKQHEIEPSGAVIETVEQFSEKTFQELKQYLGDIKNKAIEKADFELVNLALSGLFVLELYKEKEYQNKSFFNLARMNNALAGFSVVIMGDNGEVASTFTGVSPDFRRRGIATQLIQARHEVLRARGVKQYRVTIWDASEKVIEKALGKPLQVPEKVINEEQKKKVRIVDLT